MNSISRKKLESYAKDGKWLGANLLKFYGNSMIAR